MSLSITLDVVGIKATVAAIEAFLDKAKNAEKEAQSACDEAQQKLDDAVNNVKLYSQLLNQFIIKSEGEVEDRKNDSKGDDAIATRKTRSGIDVMTLQLLKESGLAKTSDEIFAMVANASEVAISDKTVKNALGEYVRTKKLVKRYSKEKGAYLYSYPEVFNEDTLLNEQQLNEASSEASPKEGASQQSTFSIFDQKESATTREQSRFTESSPTEFTAQ